MFTVFSFAIAAFVSPGTPRVPSGMAIIPAGQYQPLYGASRGGVHVAAFALDRLPVTRAQFLAFVREHREWRTDALDAGTPRDLQRPVVSISVAAARAYCAAQQKRLPTTAEWEHAAVAPPSDVLAQYAARVPGAPDVVGTGPVNRYGVRHLHDRVWEWTDDFDAPLPHEHDAHATGAGASRAHVECASAALGASNTTDYPAFLRNAMRAALTPQSTTRNLGFRCAASLAA
jgi:formylglycine-generating enzyme required for sulfatase activity